ncbi:hypothetical protein VSS74_24820 [Conexibacter stalactiti]|uniref:Uncharacterized protein n=1 Tax=Conexibacter stalactiti TaxID=1940611 RepID=A0ABU4HW98_9ACTN|nr:hypothetical protein [Conexibacter stalactiti]MDW5597597.1 hypothetical protein [Conexibacter stalactiti]MEC5038239.1 hypothetical protein [Conexibacter stalactiti]
MLRPLPPALAALAAAALLSPAAATAAPPACRAGSLTVQITTGKGSARTLCKRLPARAPAATPRRVALGMLPSARELRAALPARRRAALPLAKLRRLDSTLDRLAGRRLAAAALAADGPATGSGADCSARPTFTIDPRRSNGGGVDAVATGGGWTSGSGSTRGSLVEVAADVRAAGGTITGTQTSKDCISWDPCPDANGIVHGTLENTTIEAYVGRVRGGTVRLRTEVKVTAKLTARVGDDARVKTFDAVVDGALESSSSSTETGRRARHAPTRVVRLHATWTGIDPRAPRGALERVADGAARGAKGARLSDAEFKIAGNLYGLARLLLGNQAPRALLDAEGNWNRGRCLTVVLTPANPEVTPGQRVDVRIEVKRPDGSEAGVPFTLTPYDGAVGPPTGTTPATVTWTAPQQLDRGTFTTFEVAVTSRQGKAEGFHQAHAAPQVPWYRITFSGEGSYQRHEMGDGNPQVDARHLFAWRSTTAARFPFFDELPAGTPSIVNTDATELTGTLDGWRTDGAGRRGCGTTPESGAGIVGVVRQTRTADGGFDVAITPFPWLHPVGGIQLECDSGAFHFWTRGTRAAMTFGFHLSKAQLDARQPIVLEARPQQPLEADCYGGEANGDWACEQSVQWSGSVRLDPIDPAPTRTG